MMRRLAIACCIVIAASAAGPAGAAGSHTAVEQVSLGTIGGNAVLPTQFMGASSDGTRVILRTEEQLAASDTDTAFDLYERADGVTTHLSTGPSGGNSPGVLPDVRGTSADAKRVLFELTENLVPEDTDDCNEDDPEPNPCVDVYMSLDGATTLISTAPGANGAHPARFAGASEDGARVFFSTAEPLVAADTDSKLDVYQRSGSTTTLISTGPAGGNGSFDASFQGAAADGSRVLFSTSEQLTTDDTDSGADLYERVGGSTNLVSTGPGGAGSDAGASFEAVSRNGARAFFSTTDRLTAQDTDDSRDIYERAFGSTTLVSTGPAGGNGSFDSELKAISEIGTRVLFESPERLVSADTDSAIDVYERSGGATALVSTGPAGGNGAQDAFFQGASSDATHVVFGTAEALVGGDTDSMLDLYERTSGATTLVSTAPGGGNGEFEAYFSDISADGRRVFFETLEPLVSDSDSLPDLYERTAGTTTRLSIGSGGGNGNFIAVFLGAADDGSRVFFNTAEVLAGTDGDTASDVYVARTTGTYVRPKGATPLSVPLAIAYRPCTDPNRVHSSPALGGTESAPSCAPPAPSSNHLTVGTFDANDRPAQATGRVRFAVVPGDASTPADEADVRLRLDIGDVRRQGSLDDYTGELTAAVDVRITDRFSGSAPVDSGTVEDIPFGFVATCAATPDSGVGATCGVDTSADAVVPGVIRETLRSNWEFDRIEVYDGGADGVAATAGNTLFAVQGIFIP